LGDGKKIAANGDNGSNYNYVHPEEEV